MAINEFGWPSISQLIAKHKVETTSVYDMTFAINLNLTKLIKIQSGKYQIRWVFVTFHSFFLSYAYQGNIFGPTNVQIAVPWPGG